MRPPPPSTPLLPLLRWPQVPGLGAGPKKSVPKPGWEDVAFQGQLPAESLGLEQPQTLLSLLKYFVFTLFTKNVFKYT